MMHQVEQLQLKVAGLSDRAARVSKKAWWFLGAVATCLIVFGLTYLFKTPSMLLTDLDIPSTLNEVSNPGGFGLGAKMAEAANDFQSMFSSGALFLAIFLALLALFVCFSCSLSESLPAFLLAGVCMWVHALIKPLPEYSAPVEAIIAHNTAEPISMAYINQVSSLDARYLLGQVAIISGAKYPAAFFDTLARDLAKDDTELSPSPLVRYAVEMAAYGELKDPGLIQTVTTVKASAKVAGIVREIAIWLAVTFGLLFLGTATLSAALRRRLNNIQQMILAFGERGENA
ncbi:hypothetical protein D3C80_144360 [compost metagenome]